MPLTPVIMPKTGAEMEEGRILAWKKKVGEKIEKGEVLLEIETDKATMEVEAPASGVLLERLYQEGDVAPATQLIAVLGDGNEPREEVQALLSPKQGPTPETTVTATPAPPALPSVPIETPAVIKASPLARRLANEKGIDLATIQGTGADGRIEKEDVLRAAESKAAEPKVVETKAADAREASVLIPLSTMRRAIARRVTRSKQEMPDFSVVMLMDMTAALRRKTELQASGKHISINDLLAFAVSRTLPAHPDCNARLEGDSLRRLPEINLGILVEVDDNLYVPVIRNADRCSLEEIAAETRRLVSKAEQKQLSEEDMAGGTFTISNLGMFGVESFTAIILPPQTSILSVGRVTDRPMRGEGDRLLWQPTMAATLTVDHRVLDGVAAAKFLQSLHSQLMAF